MRQAHFNGSCAAFVVYSHVQSLSYLHPNHSTIPNFDQARLTQSLLQVRCYVIQFANFSMNGDYRAFECSYTLNKKRGSIEKGTDSSGLACRHPVVSASQDMSPIWKNISKYHEICEHYQNQVMMFLYKCLVSKTNRSLCYLPMQHNKEPKGYSPRL